MGADKEKYGDVPIINMDYGLFKDKEGETPGPILVSRARPTGMTWPMVVPTKGVSEPWVAQRCAKWIDSLGHRKVVLRTDNEHAIKALAREIKRLRQDDSITITDDHPAEGEHSENSIVEKAVDTCKGMVRTLKDSLERHLDRVINPKEPIMKWMVEHVGYLISRFTVGKDGKTPYDRWKGKRSTRPTCEFGEKILYMPLRSSKGAKEDLEPRFHYGIFLGGAPGQPGDHHRHGDGRHEGALNTPTAAREPVGRRSHRQTCGHSVGTQRDGRR